MARCKDCIHDKVCDEWAVTSGIPFVNSETCEHFMPTADVVPKSEVLNILDELMKEARAIADRYGKSANETSDYDYARIEYRGCQLGALLVSFKIAELKKKYTEDKDEQAPTRDPI